MANFTRLQREAGLRNGCCERGGGASCLTPGSPVQNFLLQTLKVQKAPGTSSCKQFLCTPQSVAALLEDCLADPVCHMLYSFCRKLTGNMSFFHANVITQPIILAEMRAAQITREFYFCPFPTVLSPLSSNFDLKVLRLIIRIREFVACVQARFFLFCTGLQSLGCQRNRPLLQTKHQPGLLIYQVASAQLSASTCKLPVAHKVSV